jgi:hypothetical protein
MSNLLEKLSDISSKFWSIKITFIENEDDIDDESENYGNMKKFFETFSMEKKSYEYGITFILKKEIYEFNYENVILPILTLYKTIVYDEKNDDTLEIVILFKTFEDREKAYFKLISKPVSIE